MIYADIESVPSGKYAVVYADPPWRYIPNIPDRRRTRQGRTVVGTRIRAKNSSPDNHYQTMDPLEIAAMDVGRVAADDAWLLMWFVWSKMKEAIHVCEAWGFRCANVPFVWVKTSPTTGRPVAGQGMTTRMGCEGCLVGKRGSLRRRAFDVDQVIMAPRTKHSEKPHAVRAGIEALLGDVARIELFARKEYPGWDQMGDQVQPSGPSVAHGWWWEK